VAANYHIIYYHTDIVFVKIYLKDIWK